MKQFGYVSDLISCRKCKLPFVSSVDHIEGDYKFKPGTCKDDVIMHNVTMHNVTMHNVTMHNVTMQPSI